ncbi:MAG: META domain-containing protein [Prevotella sp.]
MNAKMLCMAAMALMVSCASVKKTASLDMLNGEWNIVKVNGKDITAVQLDNRAFIGFDVSARRVYGCAGCNRMTGAMQADAATGTLTFDDKMAMTRMMCRNMEVEQQVVEAMTKVTTYQTTKTGLLLKDKEGNIVLELNRHNQ